MVVLENQIGGSESVMAKIQINDLKRRAKDVIENTGEIYNQAIDAAYEKRRPLAQANLKDMRLQHPKANPRKIIQLLDEELKKAELELGAISADFTSEAMLYAVTVFEVHQHARGKLLERAGIIDLLIIIDNGVVKSARKLLGGAVSLLAVVTPQGRGAKAAAVAGRLAVARASIDAAASKTGKPVVSEKLISLTATKLGRVPANFVTGPSEKLKAEKNSSNGKPKASAKSAPKKKN